ncbi:MAG: thioesterase family protein [Planctomycetota bacterium]|nr:thioesterase family protein [Planctomycetota bacterium]MDG1984570.1 thioesterase family protein [Planctomycetota bacterium]
MEAPEIPEFPQFVHETVTRWSDDDSQGVLNNAVYLTLFEEARHGFCRAAEVLSDGAFPFLLAQTNVRFVSPGRGGEAVRVELSTVHVGSRSFRQAYRVRSSEGAVWAEGEAALVCYDPETMQSVEIPTELREALEALKG